MKKVLFTLTAVMASAFGFAQPLAQQISEVSLKDIKASNVKACQQKPVFSDNVTNRPMKTLASGNYFKCPEGALFHGVSKQGTVLVNSSRKALSILVTTGLMDATFKNMNANPDDATWSWAGTTYTKGDGSGFVDDGNNFVWQGMPVTGNSSFPAPILVKGNDQYFFRSGSSSQDPTYRGESDLSMLSSFSFLAPLSYDNPNGIAYYGYQEGQYNYGPGTTSTGDAEYTNIGVRQHFSKPMSPLYVSDVFVRAITKNGNKTPISGDAVITMKITGDDGTVIAEMTAGNSDFIEQFEPTIGGNWGVATYWSVTFTKKVDHPVLGQMDSPFVIDQPFTVDITGFDQTGVDFGFFAYAADEEDPMEPASYLCKDDQGSPIVLTPTQGGESLPVTFTALFDNINVAETLYDTQNNPIENCNVVRISDDGTQSYLENGATDKVYIQTARPWYAEDGTENYSYEVASASDEYGDWIYSCEAGNDWAELENYTNLVSFTAEECPTGEGRWAVLYITGSGFTSATPVILLQGTATIDDVVMPSGIENAVVDNSAKKGFDENAPVYNLNGQRVSKSAKGILIQDGRKFIRK